MNRNLLLKLLIVGAISVLLLVPLAMIQLTVAERAGYRAEAVRSVQASLAGPQTVVFPFVIWQYREDWDEQVYNKDAKRDETVKRSYSGRRLTFAESVAVTAKIDVRNDHYRGLHRIRTYDAATTMRLAIRVPPRATVSPTHAHGRLTWAAAELVLPITDVRGLRGTPKLAVNGVAIPFEQGIGEHGIGSHIRATLPPTVEGTTAKIEIELALAGMESIAFAPSGDSNELQLQSSWPHPSFGGRFLPGTRQITDAGFSARWDVSSLAAATQAQLHSGAAKPVEAFSVDFVEPVNVYLLAERATKYGVLFIALAFAALLMFEVLRAVTLHPVQYGFLGLALAIFFLLLLALSEHIAFAYAYGIAATACVSLIATYLRSVLGGTGRASTFGLMLVAAYGAIYLILIAEKLALLMGTGLLFAVLAALMLMTRRINWYTLTAKAANTTTPEGVALSASRSG